MYVDKKNIENLNVFSKNLVITEMYSENSTWPIVCVGSNN